MMRLLPCNPRGGTPIRRIAVIVLLLAAPLTLGTAFANDQPSTYHSASLDGKTTAARTASGSCTAKTTGENVTLHCAAGKGQVSVRYDFTLQGKPSSVMYEVFTDGRTSKGLTKKITRSGSRLSVTASLTGANTQAVINLVSIQYYTTR